MTTRIRKGYLDTPSGQIHYRRVAGPGAPLVLLHRTPVDSSSFEKMLNIFAGHRAAIALDTPGFGQSFIPDFLPSTAHYAAWFLAALDAAGIGDFHLCAHHTGTHFAVELAQLAAKRTRSLLLSGVLYATADERGDMRRQIGVASAADNAGHSIAAMWTLMKSLFPRFEPDLCSTELVGALGHPAGRDQAFNAILSQDFAEILATLDCPIAIAQASDDPLTLFLDRIRDARPDIPITPLGPAVIAAPELQPDQYATRALAFAAQHDASTHRQPTGAQNPMTDIRFELVRSGERFQLEQTTAERPILGPGQVLVRVHAVSINRRDIMILKGEGYPVGDANHFTPMSDAAGEIVAVGPDVTNVAIGDRVISTFFQNWPSGRIGLPAIFSALGAGGPGVLAEYVVLSAHGITPMPAGWSFEVGATLPCAGVTAWSSLVTHGQIQAGDWVLIQGTGGVALFGLQIAAAMGAKPVMLSSSDAKLARAKALGAAVTINYATHPDWTATVREATGGGVQQVLELGGAGTLAKSLACLAPGGHVALVGGLTGFGGEISAAGLIMSAARVTAISVGPRANQLALADFLASHAIEPVIDTIYPLESVAEAYEHAASGAFGKIVVRFAVEAVPALSG